MPAGRYTCLDRRAKARGLLEPLSHLARPPPTELLYIAAAATAETEATNPFVCCAFVFQDVYDCGTCQESRRANSRRSHVLGHQDHRAARIRGNVNLLIAKDNSVVARNSGTLTLVPFPVPTARRLSRWVPTLDTPDDYGTRTPCCVRAVHTTLSCNLAPVCKMCRDQLNLNVSNNMAYLPMLCATRCYFGTDPIENQRVRHVWLLRGERSHTYVRVWCG